MGSKSSKSEKSNSYERDCTSSTYSRAYPQAGLYPHLVPEQYHHQQYASHGHYSNPPYVTAIPNPFHMGRVQDVAHVQAEYGAQHYTYPQPTNGVSVLSPSAPPLSLIKPPKSRLIEAETTASVVYNTNNNPPDEAKVAEKLKSLNRFLKGILATVPEHYAFKGYYCEACDCGMIRVPVIVKKKHNKNESHCKLKTDAMVERFCPTCRVDLLCSSVLWKLHEESELHKFWREKSDKNCGVVQAREEDHDCKGKKAYLVVSGFPKSTRWQKMKLFFEEFSDCVRVEMVKERHNTEYARILFRQRQTALNIHESGFPLIFENKRLITKVKWMD
ncbi:uncharacterized protein LOC111046740 [Nilaparvata lugens]|uniref:uncharacterized protein LOC111046740 n=1 Tax=Nilaparvata lugens TaxID=108931 RepID=UPI00193DD822|nr:uncharacterized protein LOC111046740 [Nilaparvata lugens]XP_039276993.1 uncharacterized protein LOC111046740 [Nilaparvata lugens]